MEIRGKVHEVGATQQVTESFKNVISSLLMQKTRNL